jgi:competence protein ComFC
VILDLLFPQKCLGCGKVGSYFCPDCLNLILLKDQQICPICGRASLGGVTHHFCRRPLGLDGLTSIFAYKGVVAKAIKKLKYKFAKDLAEELVELFLSFCGEEKLFSDFCCLPNVVLVPIPLHPQRLRWRGFNQAELLGKLIAKNLEIKFVPGLLLRVKNTKPQVELDKAQRQINIRRAFALNRNCKLKIGNWNFILFDDVWTTGATLKEAGKVLKRNGAKKVWGLTIAR